MDNMQNYGKISQRLEARRLVLDFMDANHQSKEDYVRAETKRLWEEEHPGRKLTKKTKEGKEYIAWLAINSHHIEEVAEDAFRHGAQEIYETKIAPMYGRELGNTINTAKSIIYFNQENVKKPFNAYNAPDRIMDAYQTIDPTQFFKMLETTTDNVNLVHSHIDRHTTQTPEDFIKGMNNIAARDGNIAVWDTETMGKMVDESTGRPVGQRLTEFSIGFTKGDLRAGTVDDIAEKNMYESVIGISEKEYNAYVGILDKMHRGEALTEGEQVTADRLMLYGSEKTKIKDHGNGIFTVDNIAEKSEIKGTYGEGLAGAKRLLDIGNDQRSKMVDGMYAWEKRLLKAFTRIKNEELTVVGYNATNFDIKNMSYAFTNKEFTTKKFRNDLFKLFGEEVGFKYQLDLLQYLKTFSENRPDLIRNIISSNDSEYIKEHNTLSRHKDELAKLELKYKTDQSPETKQLLDEKRIQVSEMENALEERIDNKVAELTQWLKDNDKSAFTQESLKKAKEIGFGETAEKGAHAASADVAELSEIIFKLGLLDPNSLNELTSSMMKEAGARAKAAVELNNEAPRLFYALNSSSNLDEYGLVSFTKDKVANGAIRTSDGVSIVRNPDGTAKTVRESFKYTAIKRRALYQFDGITELSSDNPIYRAVAAAHPEQDYGKLYAVILRGQNFGSAPNGIDNDNYIIGTRRQLSLYMNQNLVHAGNAQLDTDGNIVKDKNGKIVWTTEGVHEYNLDLLRVDEAPDESILPHLQEENDFALSNDAAARDIRNHDYKKDKKIYEYNAALTKQQSRTVARIRNLKEGSELTIYGDMYSVKDKQMYRNGMAINFNETMKVFRQHFFDGQYKEVRRDYKNVGYLGSAGKAPDKELGLFFKIFGFGPEQTNLYPEQFKKIQAQANFINKNQTVYKKALDFASKMGKGDDNLTQMYYQLALSKLEEKSVLSYMGDETSINDVDRTHLGWTERPRINAEYRNLYQVNLDGFRGIHDKRGAAIETFDLKNENSGYGISTQLFRKIGYISKQIEGFKQDKAKHISVLMDFQSFLRKSTGMVFDKHNQINSSDSIDIAGQKILNGMREMRKRNSKAGRLTSSFSHDIRNYSHENFGLSYNMMDSVLSPLESVKFYKAPITIKEETLSDGTKKNKYLFNPKNEDYKNFKRDIVGDIMGNVSYQVQGLGAKPTDKNSFVYRMMHQHGVSLEDAKLMEKEQQILYKELYNSVNDIVDTVYSHGGTISIDTESHKMFVHEPGSMDKFTEILMPTAREGHNGIVTVRRGNDGAPRVNQLGFNYNYRGEVSLGTRFGAAYGDTRWAVKGSYMDRNAETHGVGEAVNMAIKKTFKSLNEKMMVQNENATEFVMANAFELESMPRLLKDISQETIDTIKEKDGPHAEVFSALLANKDRLSELEKISDLQPHELSALTEFMPQIMNDAGVLSNFSAKEQDILSKVNWRKLEKTGFVRQYNSLNMPGEYSHAGANKIDAKLGQAVALDVTRGKELEDLGYGYVGSPMETEYSMTREKELSRVTGRDVSTKITGSVLNINTTDLQAVFDKYATEEEKQSAAFASFAGASTNEGSAISSARAEDLIFKDYLKQTVDTDDVMKSADYNVQFAKGTEQTDGRRLKISDTVDYFKKVNGRFQYVEGQSIIVNAGDKLFTKYSNYGKGQMVHAKQTGFLRMGWFSDSVELTPDKLNDLINNADREITDSAAAVQYLYELGYTRKFKIDALNISGTEKLAQLDEKVMPRSNRIALGVADEKLKAFLNNNLQMDKVDYEHSLVGKFLDYDVIDELRNVNDKEDFARSRFYLALKNAQETAIRSLNKGKEENYVTEQVRRGVMSVQEILDNIIGSYGSVYDFGQAILDERYMGDDMYQNILRRAGILTDPGQRIMLTANVGPGIVKHGSISAIDQTINALKRIDRYGTESGRKEFFTLLKKNGWDIDGDIKQYGKLFNEGEYKTAVNKTIAEIMSPVGKTIQVNKNGELIDNNHGQGYGYDTKAIKDIAQRFFDGTLAKTVDGGITFAISDAQIAQLPNVDRPGIGLKNIKDGQEMRFDERMAHNARTHLLSENQVKGLLSDETAQKIMDNPLLKGLSEHLQDSIGKPYLGDVNRKLAERVFYTDRENRVYDKYVEATGNQADMAQIEKERQAVYADLEERGMTTKQIDNAIKSMKAEGAPVITGDRIMKMHTAASYLMAREYNADRIDPEKLIKSDEFRLINIGNADDSKVLTSAIEENSLHGRAYLLDFNDAELDALQEGSEHKFGLLKETTPGNKLVIPFLEIGAKNEKGEYMSSGVSGKVSQILNLRQDIIDRMKVLSGNPNAGNYEDDDIIDKNRNRIQDLVDEIGTEISRTATNSHGIFKEAVTAHHKDGVTYLSAQGFNFSGTSADGAFGKLSFNGVNLAQQAKDFAEGKSPMDLDFAIINSELRNKYYSLNRLSETLGGNQTLAKELQETVFNQLSTEGTLSSMIRHPVQQNRSTGATALYFSDNVSLGHIYVNERRMEQMKGDFDSDRLLNNIITARANIKIGDQTFSRDVDFATYRGLKEMQKNNALSVDLVEADKNVFNDAYKDILAGAMYSNPMTRNIAELGSENTRKKAAYAALSADDFAGLTWDGRRTINYAAEYTPEQENVLGKDYSDLIQSHKEHYLENHTEEEFKALREDPDKYKAHVYLYGQGNLDSGKNIDNIMHFGALHEAKITYNEAVNSKQSAGILNDALYRLDRMVELGSQIGAPKGAAYTPAENNLLRAGFEALQEATLSGKNEKGVPDLDRVVRLGELTKRMTNAMAYGGSMKKEAVDALHSDIKEFLEPIFLGRANKEFARTVQDGSDAVSKLANYAGQTIEGYDKLSPQEQASATATLIADMFKRMSTSKAFNDSMRLTVSKTGLDKDARLAIYSVENSPLQGLQVVGRMAQNSTGIKTNPITQADLPSVREEFINQQDADDYSRNLSEAKEKMHQDIEDGRRKYRDEVEDGGREVISKASNSLQHSARRIAGMFKGSPITSAAVGIAAGLITAGYASPGFSNHAVPAPATTQAVGASTDEQEMVATMAPVPSLSDANMNVMRGGPSSGYVININATSPEGKDAAVAAVKNAASGMTPQTGSINVSVNTSASDSLNQLQVNRMVAQSLGIA